MFWTMMLAAPAIYTEMWLIAMRETAEAMPAFMTAPGATAWE